MLICVFAKLRRKIDTLLFLASQYFYALIREKSCMHPYLILAINIRNSDMNRNQEFFFVFGMAMVMEG